MSPDTPRSAVLARLAVPVVQAPMAGGPSTPALAAAVIRAGGLGFLAGGYLPANRMAEQIRELRGLTDGDWGVNLFVGGAEAADSSAVRAYAERLGPLAARAGVSLGEPRFDDDAFHDKLAVLVLARVPVVSFVFGLPPRNAVEALHDAGSEVWLTVTSDEEARRAADRGADALVVQGVEAGGHRGVFVDDENASDLTLLVALQLVRAAVPLPLVAAGGLMTGSALAAVLVAGASAAQLGSAFLCSDEAGTVPPHREAIAGEARTVLTRAYSGRLARGVVNDWHRAHGAHAPRAYPEIHHLTSPLRTQGRAQGDPELLNLWAGEAHHLATGGSAAAIVRRLAAEARAALDALPQIGPAADGHASRRPNDRPAPDVAP